RVTRRTAQLLRDLPRRGGAPLVRAAPHREDGMSATVRRDVVVVVVAALVALAGGCGGRGPSGGGRTAAAASAAAPPAEVIATPMALIGARDGAAIARAGDRVVVAGGATDHGASADVQELALDDGWIEPLLAALPEARVGAAA